MTFNEWEWENNKIVGDFDVPSDIFRMCWDAATKAERERIAKSFRGVFACCCDVEYTGGDLEQHILKDLTA